MNNVHAGEDWIEKIINSDIIFSCHIIKVTKILLLSVSFNKTSDPTYIQKYSIVDTSFYIENKYTNMFEYSKLLNDNIFFWI